MIRPILTWQRRRTVLKKSTMLLGLSALLTRSSLVKAIPARNLKWIAYYGYTGDEQALAAYDIVVLDPAYAGSIAAVAADGARVCAYLSLGEIRTSDPFYGQVERAALLAENPAWPGTVRIDVRRASWTQLIIDEIIPQAVDKGFAGLMLDTVDTPPYLEQHDPRVNHGMSQAAVDTIREISERFPAMFLISNRGYVLLPRIVDWLDAIVAESLLTFPDPAAAGGFRWNEPAQIDLQLSLLAPASRHLPPLPILSLDYCDADDAATMRQIYKQERQLGHHPYVAGRELDRVIAEPGPAPRG